MKYTDEEIAGAVRENVSIMGVLRALGIKMSGGQHTHIKTRIARAGIDTSHFTGQAHLRGGSSSNKKAPDQIFVILPPNSHRPKVHLLRRGLAEVGVKEECVRCGLGNEWNGRPIQLEVDHINENFLDNRQENLQYLCPNCHSQKGLGQ